MARMPLCKVYGHIYPFSEALYGALETAMKDCMGQESAEPALVREGDMARVSFEGIYFPEEAAIEAVRAHLTPAMRGKLDCLDLENWRLTRYRFEGGAVRASSAPLNNVLDFSGH